MTLLCILFSVLLLSPAFSFAAGNETMNTMPDSRTGTFHGTGTSSAQNYWRNELPDILGRYFPQGWVYSGGIFTVVQTSGINSPSFATEAFTSSGRRVTANSSGGAASIAFSSAVGCAATDAAWVIISAAATGTNTLDQFRRSGTSNYFVDCVSSTQPLLPADSTWLLRITLTSSAITTIRDLRASNPHALVFNAKDPIIGFLGDGSDETAKFAIASGLLTALRSNACLYFSPGTYMGNSSTALISVTDVSGVCIRGDGAVSSVLRQNGAGNLIDILSSSPALESSYVRISDLQLLGNDTAAKAINTNLIQNAVFERLQISSFLDHSIDFQGIRNLQNMVRDTRITPSASALTTGRGIRAVGNINRFENNYFNFGNNTARYETGLDVIACGSCLSMGNTFDGVATGIRSRLAFTSILDYFEQSTGGLLNVTTPYVHDANNTLTIIHPTSNINLTHVNFTGTDRRYIAFRDSISDAALNVRGGVLQSADFIPAQITADQNDYGPGDAADASIWNLITDASRNITGLSGGTPGKLILIRNRGSSPLTFVHDSSASLTGNRLWSSRTLNETLLSGEHALVHYSGAVGAGFWYIERLAVPNNPSEVLTPSQIVASQNDYPTPASSPFVRVHVLRLDTNAALNISGFNVTAFMHPTGEGGYQLRVLNIGTQNLGLLNQDTGSLAANRIVTGTGGSLVLLGNETATLIYDATALRWRVVSRHP